MFHYALCLIGNYRLLGLTSLDRARTLSPINQSKITIYLLSGGLCIVIDVEAHGTARIYVVILTQLQFLAIMENDGTPFHVSKGFTTFARSKSSPSLLHMNSLIASTRESELEFKNDCHGPFDGYRVLIEEEKVDLLDRRPRRAMSENINDLKRLESDVEVLQRLIRQKESLIINKLRSRYERMREELRHCDGVKCFLNAIGHYARDTSELLLKDSETVNLDGLDTIPLVPQNYKPNKSPDRSVSIVIDSDLPSNSSPCPPSQPATIARPRNPWLALINVIVASLGLGILFSFVRRFYYSLRKQIDRLVNQEGRHNNRARHCASWRAFWRQLNCFPCCARPRSLHFHHSPSPTYSDEKQRLVREQESVLDADMHAQVDAICDQHAISTELQSIRRSYGFIDALVQAEEGRRYDSRRDRSCSGIDMGFSNILNILQTNINGDSPQSPPSASPAWYPNSYSYPCPYRPSPPSPTSSIQRSSQTSSPPPYSNWSQSQPDCDTRTAPPEYQSETDDNNIVGLRINGFRRPTVGMSHHVADGFPAYEPASSMDGGRFAGAFGTGRTCTPVSSVPDLSPRPSVETIRTGGCGGRGGRNDSAYDYDDADFDAENDA